MDLIHQFYCYTSVDFCSLEERIKVLDQNCAHSFFRFSVVSVYCPAPSQYWPSHSDTHYAQKKGFLGQPVLHIRRLRVLV
jgi:hypothetical protein